MQLTVTFDSEGTADEVVVYDGSDVEAMSTALESYITANLPTQQQKYVRRWWVRAKVNVENGLEPELRYVGTVGVDVWKVWQVVGS